MSSITNQLSTEQQAQVIRCLAEGNSINATVRMTGIAHTTILRLIRRVGAACARFHDAHVQNVNAERVQCDEVWSFCYAKAKNVPEELRNTPGFGSIWTWTAIDADSKLIISWLASDRSQDAANALMADLKGRTRPWRIQITSDGFSAYIDAIAAQWKNYGDVDYAEEIKVYANSSQPGMSPNAAASRYSPGRVASVQHIPRIGMPLDKFISTAYMERWNLTLRMQNRRFTRLTNGFSKKFEMHRHMLALTITYYNFCRKHRSLKGQTPAMVAGVTDYAWTASDLLALDPMWIARAA